MSGYQEILDNTRKMFGEEDYKVGNRITERFSYWIYIVYNDKEKRKLGFIEYTNNPNSKFTIMSYEDFKEMCSYTTNDHYWVDLIDNDIEKTKIFLNEFIEYHSVSLDKMKVREANLIQILSDV